MTWTPETSRGFESRKIKYLLPRYTRGRGLEIGCGMEKAFPHFIGIDNGHHFGKGAADIVGQADDLSMFADEAMDFVFSSHVLEHMEDMEAALSEWGRVIRPGGYLILYVPSANLYPKCGEPGANPDHKHDIYPEEIEGLFDKVPYFWTLVEFEERSRTDEYSIFVVLQKVAWDCQKPPVNRPKIIQSVRPERKTACVCRFGGFGDMLQAAIVFPRLKDLDYHVTVMTTPKGMDVIRHDPDVDEWFLLDQDQIPNNELSAFWRVQARRFDRFINLSESIEGNLLALPGRTNHSWPHDVRKKRMNTNYHEWTAELAGVPFRPCQLFYPTVDETSNARGLIKMQAADNEPTFTILWALAGSSIHKFYPHQDAVIARILVEIPEAQIYLVGDDACRLLEQGWEEEPRVHLLSGKMSIRDTLALARAVDLVIGPETGVLNAVGMDKSPHKILFLSHSSANNLSKHWVNVQSFTPGDCDCHPCHQLHYGPEFCQTDEATGAARCAVNISPYDVGEAVMKVYRNWRKR